MLDAFMDVGSRRRQQHVAQAPAGADHDCKRIADQNSSEGSAENDGGGGDLRDVLNVSTLQNKSAENSAERERKTAKSRPIDSNRCSSCCLFRHRSPHPRVSTSDGRKVRTASAICSG